MSMRLRARATGLLLPGLLALLVSAAGAQEAPAAASDDLALALDYARVSQSVITLVQSAPHELTKVKVSVETL